MIFDKTKLMSCTRRSARYVFLFLFILVTLATALGYPTYSFIIGAFVFMCYIHYAVSLPAIKCTEEPLYGNDPKGFFDQKVRLTAIMWVGGIIVMVIIFALLMYLEGVLPATDPEILPDVNIAGSVILLLFSLALFIPITFVLMKASYEYDGKIMKSITLAMLLVMFALCIATALLGLGSPPESVISFYTFDTIPFLPLSILALAASLIITYYLSKSAKKSFIRYINDENV